MGHYALNKIGFLGGGKMAQAMAKGFISAGKIFRLNNDLRIHLCNTRCHNILIILLEDSLHTKIRSTHYLNCDSIEMIFFCSSKG